MRHVQPPTGFHTVLVERLLRELGNLTRLSIDWPNAGWSEMCFRGTWKIVPAGPPVREWIRTTNDTCDVDKLRLLYEGLTLAQPCSSSLLTPAPFSDDKVGFLRALHPELRFGL